MTDTTDFAIPGREQQISPIKMQGLADALKVHGRNRRGGYSTEIVDRIMDRLVYELGWRDRSQSAEQAAAAQATAALAEWSEGYAADRGEPFKPSPAEVQTLMAAQFQADDIVAAGRGEIAEAGLPPKPEPTDDPAVDVLAWARWYAAATPAAKEYADTVRAALPVAEQQEVDVRTKADRFAGVLPIANALMPGGGEPAVDVTEIDLTDTEQVAS